jgi:penicillin-binding protein 1A
VAEDDDDEEPQERPKRTAKRRAKSSRKRKPVAKSDDEAPKRSPLRRIVYWGAVLCLWGLILAAGTIALVASTLPPIQTLAIPKRPPSIEIEGIDGKPLAVRGEMGGAAVALKDLPPYVPRAFLAIEDRRFYFHHGVDPIGLTRAVIANVLHRGVAQGGSTITQQLAKNLFLNQQRTLWRKLQELVLALWIERKFSKDAILELYLNRVYFGSGAYGVEAAAQRYFGKNARNLTLAEAAMLAGLVKSPSKLAPTRNPDGAERRAQLVLTAMAEADFITETMAKAAMAQPAHAVKPTGAGSIGYVADWIMDVLDDLIGDIDGDLKVDTTIDPALQAAAERALTDELAQKGARLDVEQGALVAMSPDGAVRAMVGGKSYAESQYNRAVAAKRQPGSAFKPFVYLTALEHGLTPDTVREDKPIALKGWKPENFGRQYWGPVTLTQALAMSLNTVSVRLTLELGPAAVAKTAYRLGIASKLDPNPSLALGTSEVSLIELVAAYAPFANDGFAIAPHVVERVRTATGKTLYTRLAPNFGRVIDPRYVGMMNAMMRETLISGTAHAAQLAGWPAAGKTGTSQEFRDAWFIGYTSHLVTGVWLGNDDSSPPRKATGGGLPVEIWSRFMRPAHQGLAVVGLPELDTGLSLASIVGGPSGAAIPPAPIAVQPRGERNPSLDGWFLDHLFGRR